MGKLREFNLTDRDFDRIRNLAMKHLGIALADTKRELVYSRLTKRLRQFGMSGFSDYCDLLETGDVGELVHFTNAITTNLTSFFRENHHFEALTKTLLPELMKKKSRDRRLRIWSAGCSTGEEPYSIAMSVKETIPQGSHWDVKILATDIDSNVLATASRGVYGVERIGNISKKRLKQWFMRGRGEHEGMAKVSSELQDMITFRRLNLMEEWPVKGCFDVIFCRNVVIYFDKETQKNLFDRFAEKVDDHGYIIVGHSESLFKVTDRFELLGQTIYRKIK
ncbi:MAG: protein-glutamate O-methyltransferase [Gammaproteobacteria bacterium]|nr:protein-glutamate O-methyltransferase [Gammaproteobacteria bacterium]